VHTGTIRRLVGFGLLGALAPGLLTASVASGSSGTSGDPSPAASVIVPVTPFRILDTRNGTGTAGSTAPVGVDSAITVQMAGVGPVPAGATGVVVNLTATEATATTFITAFPAGTPRSTTSVLNVTPGVNIANTITVAVGSGGALALYNFAGNVHLIADVTGYLVDASPPKDHTLVLGAYEGRIVSGTALLVQYGCMRLSAGGDVWYDVPLPDGAVVTSVDVHYYDADATQALTVELWFSSWADPATPTNVGQPVVLPDTGGTWTSSTIQLPGRPPMSAPSRYYLEANLGTSPQLLFCGADIHYTL
jgi:hypothetical protein